MRKAGGFGVAVLVVVMATVLLLVAQAWKKVAPTAVEIKQLDGNGAFDAHGQTDAAGEVRSGALPKLSDMERSTDAHTAEVAGAIASAE
jgi:hypothetical protein